MATPHPHPARRGQAPLDRRSEVTVSRCEVGARVAGCTESGESSVTIRQGGFMADLAQRVEGRFQIMTDGFDASPPAILENFGAGIDFAQSIKQYVTPQTDGPDWYKAARFVRTIPSPISGNPDEDRISTSHVERVN